MWTAKTDLSENADVTSNYAVADSIYAPDFRETIWDSSRHLGNIVGPFFRATGEKQTVIV